MPSHLVLPRLNFTSSFLNFLHPPQWTVQGSGEWSWSARNTVFAAPFSSHFFPAPAWVFSMAPSWTVAMYVLPTRQVLQELLQCMCFPWGLVLQEQTGLHGSSTGLSPVRKTASVWVSAQTAACVSALMCPSWPAGEQPASPGSFPQAA